jgi:hypothetical protein
VTSHKTDLSTEISPIIPDAYPHEIFMLHCFFVARAAGLRKSPLTGNERK